MNCKPNQVVVVVRTPPWATEFLGRIYRTRALFSQPVGPSFWLMSEGNLVARDGSKVDGIEDKYLKPIRPVGEGETDEMVRIAGKPTQFKNATLRIGHRHDKGYAR